MAEAENSQEPEKKPDSDLIPYNKGIPAGKDGDSEISYNIKQVGNIVKGSLAGRDINNVTNNNTYIEVAVNEEEDIGVIAEVFAYVSTQLASPISTAGNRDLTLNSLSNKIKINFTSNQVGAIRGTIENLWARKMLVSKFIQDMLETEEGEQTVLALKDDIQSNFMRLMESESTDVVLNDVLVFSDLAELYVPELKRRNVNYMANAKAIILYFFELCDIGLKTNNNANDSQQLGLTL
jgi:hypothetical protein